MSGFFVRQTAWASARRSPFLRLLTAAGALLVGAPAAAQDYEMREVGRWTVAASQDGDGCFMTRTYAGPGRTTLLLGLDADGSNRLSVLNANWSIKPKDRQNLTYRLSNASFPKRLSIGIASDGKRGFVTSFGKPFPTLFASSTFLHIVRGEVPVDQLSLDGSGAAVAELRKCIERTRRAPAADAPESERTSKIPLDPFAPDAARTPKK